VARLPSHLLMQTMLRPFGEHLAANVQPRAQDICVQSSGDDRYEIAIIGTNTVVPLRAGGAALPLRDGSAQVVTSLFTLAFEPDPAAALGELLRILDPDRGRLGVALWSEPGAVPHLDALAAVDEETVAAATQFGHLLAAEHLVEQAGGAQRIQVSRIHDVVRFDGVAHWWAAVAGGAPDAVPAIAEARLRPYAVADGTLRIPTEAVLLTTAEGRAAPET
jgi:hypothetical protein